MILSKEFRSELRMLGQCLHHQRVPAPEHREYRLLFDREMREQVGMVGFTGLLLELRGPHAFREALAQFPTKEQSLVVFAAQRTQ